MWAGFAEADFGLRVSNSLQQNTVTLSLAVSRAMLIQLLLSSYSTRQEIEKDTVHKTLHIRLESKKQTHDSSRTRHNSLTQVLRPNYCISLPRQSFAVESSSALLRPSRLLDMKQGQLNLIVPTNHVSLALLNCKEGVRLSW